MNLLRLATVCAGSAWRQRRRAWPAAAGIAVGVGAMVTMVAVGRGAERSVVDRISSMGTELVIVTAGQVKLVAGRPRQVGNVTTLTLEDAERVAAECPSVRRASPVQSRKLPLKWGELSTTTTVVGAGPDILAVRNLEVGQGRAFDETSDRAMRRVAVLGQTVVTNLFGDRPVVGETVRIARVPFEIIGVLTTKGLDAHGIDQDDVVLIPVRTALRRLFNLDHINDVYVQARGGRAEAAALELRAYLRERHRLREGKPDDFTVQNQAEVLAAESGAARSFTLLLTAVSAVALLIGGVGVLAVMLIAVRERVREVGLRRALGATRREILLQFAGEAVAVGVVGGLAGVVLGVAAALGASALGAWPVVISVPASALALAVSILVAVGFGSIPAARAANLDPATSLRAA